MNRTSRKVELVIIQMLSIGKSIRKIQKITSVDKTTIASISRRNEVATIFGCDHCRVRRVSDDSRRFKRTGRSKHQFCSTYCYGKFYAKLRENDTCKRCGMIRKERMCAVFIRGYCQKCYGLLREFNFNNDLADSHDLNQKLKEVVKNGNQKHVAT